MTVFGNGSTRTVVQNVDCAVASDRRRDRRLYAGFIGNVSRDENRIAALVANQFLDGASKIRFDFCNGDLRAFARK